VSPALNSGGSGRGQQDLEINQDALAATSSILRNYTSTRDKCSSACARTKRPSWLRLENPLTKAAHSHASGAVLGRRDLSGKPQARNYFDQRFDKTFVATRGAQNA
jgi:hypothetical protein